MKYTAKHDGRTISGSGAGHTGKTNGGSYVTKSAANGQIKVTPSTPIDLSVSKKDYAAEVLVIVKERLYSVVNDDSKLSALIDHLGSPEQVADRMLAALPLPDPYDELVGPFYDTNGLAKLRGVSRQAIHGLMRRRTLLGVHTGEGDLLFPAFQLGAAGAALPHLREVLNELDPEDQDAWGSALWLNTPADRFGGRTAARTLFDGDTGAVLEAAHRDAAVWAQ